MNLWTSLLAACQAACLTAGLQNARAQTFDGTTIIEFGGPAGKAAILLQLDDVPTIAEVEATLAPEIKF